MRSLRGGTTRQSVALVVDLRRLPRCDAPRKDGPVINPVN